MTDQQSTTTQSTTPTPVLIEEANLAAWAVAAVVLADLLHGELACLEGALLGSTLIGVTLALECPTLARALLDEAMAPVGDETPADAANSKAALGRIVKGLVARAEARLAQWPVEVAAAG